MQKARYSCYEQRACFANEREQKAALRGLLSSDLLWLDHLAATVHAVGADVMTQAGFAGAVVNDHIGCHEGIV